MTATQNNFLGPAALIFSCCFPAKHEWELETCGLGAVRELAHAIFLSSEARENLDDSLPSVLRRRGSMVFGGAKLRIY